MAFSISVIICTHNPREDNLRRTMEALNKQTLPKDEWELLLVDNASLEELSGRWDLSWHPFSRHVRENELGLTPARLRGIDESRAEMLLFVDDDNLLNPHYLERILEIENQYPWVGAFGGKIEAEFESEPEKEILFMLPYLAIREVLKEEWACLGGTKAGCCAPCGAGMAIRTRIASAYAKAVRTDPIRRSLDRVGSSLSSAGDSDMALFACSMGFAVGRFPQLSLKHLIPARRIEREYLIKLAEAMAESNALLEYVWSGSIPEIPTSPGKAERLLRIYQSLRIQLRKKDWPDFEEKIRLASLRGQMKARFTILGHQSNAK